MNTIFSYLYRDAGNYKFYNKLVLLGVLRSDQIVSYLNEGTYFIPSEVGMPDLQPDLFTRDDHIWHEIDSIQCTTEEPSCDLSAHMVIERFRIAKICNWNEVEVMKRKGVVL